ncbi:hypothetical protein [Nocardia otitidiscaviarum]|nr:hypothetical protein [Nocardia otitidiscaviarum]
MRIGNGRVSTRDQHPEAQHDVFTAAGCEQIFIDEASDKLASRPELIQLTRWRHCNGRVLGRTPQTRPVDVWS